MSEMDNTGGWARNCDDVLEAARRNKAPQRVMDLLQRIEDERYRDMGRLLEKIGDYAWNHD